MESRIRAWRWQGPHQVAQKSTTTIWPGKSTGPILRPSRVLSRKSGLEPTPAPLLPSTASLQPKSSSEKSVASIRTERRERARWEELFIFMASQAYGNPGERGSAGGGIAGEETTRGGEGIPGGAGHTDDHGPTRTVTDPHGP